MGRFKTLEERQNKQMKKKGKLPIVKELPKTAATTQVEITKETK